MHKIYQLFTFTFVGMIFSACSTLLNFQEEVIFSADEGPAFLQSAATFGIQTEAQHYHQARRRWTRVSGERLKRRALILALNPSSAQLQRLDSNFAEIVELEILNDLLGKSQSKVSKFTSK